MTASGRPARTDTKSTQNRRRIAKLAAAVFREEDMRVRESRTTINCSLTTAAAVGCRTELLRYIADRLLTRGLQITDDMIHIDHVGYNQQTDWDEYRIMVDRFGVFGFADGPFPEGPTDILPALCWPTEQTFAAEIETCFDVPCKSEKH
jgi:hypothetical protein